MKVNEYIRSLKKVSDSEYPGIVGSTVAIRNKCGCVEIRTVIGIFKDDNLADNQLVFLLDDGRYIVKRYDEMRREVFLARTPPGW